MSFMSEPEGEEPTDAQPPSFFRSFVFSPEVPIRLDYQGKHVDMDQVRWLMVLLHWHCLVRAIFRSGSFKARSSLAKFLIAVSEQASRMNVNENMPGPCESPISLIPDKVETFLPVIYRKSPIKPPLLY